MSTRSKRERIYRVRCNTYGRDGCHLGVRVIQIQAVNRDDAFAKLRKIGCQPIALA